MNGIEIRIDGALVTADRIETWERSRSLAVLRFLHRKLGRKAPPRTLSTPQLRIALAQVKLDIGQQDLRCLLERDIRVSDMMASFLVKLSGNQRKLCMVDMHIPGAAAGELAEGLDMLMLRNPEQHAQINLAACPDHYVLQPKGEVLEVLESTGSSPFASRFFMHYGDERGIATPPDPNFTHQSYGTARSAESLDIGAIRHQLRDIDGGTHARLLVEFPHATPNHVIRQHQLHLACEFSHWFHYLQNANEQSVLGSIG